MTTPWVFFIGYMVGAVTALVVCGAAYAWASLQEFKAWEPPGREG